MNDIRIQILVDNNTFIDRYYLGEPGLSVFVETDGKRILFDTGYSNIIIENAGKMSINLLDLDHIVLSHGHIDHTGGLDCICRLFLEAFLEKREFRLPEIIAHPGAFLPKRLEKHISIGSNIGIGHLRDIFPVRLSKEPLIMGNMAFLGEIPHNNSFEAKGSMGFVKFQEGWVEDHLVDDTALAIDTRNGLIIITGCSHSGICNIADRAAKIFNRHKILDIIGGLHLINASDEVIDKTIGRLKEYKPENIHPCHCTGQNAIHRLKRHFNVYETAVGLKIEY